MKAQKLKAGMESFINDIVDFILKSRLALVFVVVGWTLVVLQSLFM